MVRVGDMGPSKTEALRQAQQFINQGKLSSAIPIYQKIVEGDSSDLAAITVLGDLYVRCGRVSDAVDHFLRIAENYVRSGSAISAANLIRKVLKLDPANARANMNLGELFLHEGKIDQAHGHFIEAGAAFWHKGNIAAAIKMNQRALASKPDSRQAKTALALLEQEGGQTVSAPKPLRVTGELEPILISIPDDPQQVTAAEAFQDQAQPKPELPSRRTAPLTQPEPAGRPAEDSIIESIARAEMLVGEGRAEQALALLREALLQSPDHIQVREKLKDIYLRTEMIDRASEECLNIAGIYAARGETNRSRDYVNRARALRESGDQVAPASALQGTGETVEEVRGEDLAWDLKSRQSARVM